MTSADIRRQYIDFFIQKHGHTFVPSSPVVPHDDPTLLFTNAGMNQFKPIFLGQEKRSYTRAVNTQKCIRAGGKHNDLDDVGRSRRHHTFFEMLGNWSFGDYFKRGAIEMAWELLTKVWKLDPTRLHVSCYEGNEAAGIPRDTEAAEIWKEVANWSQYGLKNDDFIHYFGKDNFWEMGETGPCGPCTEIYIDRTPDKTGGPEVNGDDPRVMEIWNLVFIQYNRDASGKLTPLPAQHVDTGMGLERICQVLQDKADNYGTDLWTPIFDALTTLTGINYRGKFPPTNAADVVAEAADPQLRHDIAFRVIADHLRCLTFAITDGAMPSNEGRGYVLRRILRRAVRFGRQQLDLKQPFLSALVPVLVDTMSEMFPELKANPQRVMDILKDEEVSFGKTIDRGIDLFEEAANFAKANQEQQLVISAADAFKLYDTYGFPIDLTRIMAEERGMKVDLPGYEKLMEEARERSRVGGKDESLMRAAVLSPDALAKLAALHVKPTDDSFKYEHKPLRATLTAVWNGENFDDVLDSNNSRPTEPVAVIVDKTCFYGEMGGQVGDAGEMSTDHGVFVVTETRVVGGYVLHLGHVKTGRFNVNDSVTLSVLDRRAAIEGNHTSTHLANWALRETLGDHVQQKGSLVDAEKLRFDFVHPKALSDEEIAGVEKHVAAQIAKNLPVYAVEAPQETALKIFGLRAVFGEKYPPMVRVVSIGAPVADLLADPENPKWRQYSVEFCGGTHLSNSGVAQQFVITSEEAVSKGIRRLVAYTGTAAKAAIEQANMIEGLIGQAAQTPDDQLPGLIAALQKMCSGSEAPLLARRRARAAISDLQNRVKKAAKSGGGAAALDVDALLAKATTFGAGTVLIVEVPDATADTLRQAWEAMRKKSAPTLAAVLATVVNEKDKEGNALPPKVSVLAGVGDGLIAKLSAGDWIKAIAPVIGGTGGGRPQMAMAGGKDVAKLPELLAAAAAFAREKLG
jgi:alanyl-tRNA synthetase